jgi:hypothetical protein
MSLIGINFFTVTVYCLLFYCFLLFTGYWLAFFRIFAVIYFLSLFWNMLPYLSSYFLVTVKRCDRILWLALRELRCGCSLISLTNFTFFNTVFWIRDILLRSKFFCVLPFEGKFYIILQSQNVIKKSQNSRNQGFSYYFCFLIEGSGSVQIMIDQGGPKTSGSGFTTPV